MDKMMSGLLVTGLILLLAGCGQFRSLKQDVDVLEAGSYQINARATAPGCRRCNIFMLSFAAGNRGEHYNYRLLASGESVTGRLPSGDNRLFFFNDTNEDFRYSAGEPAAWTDVAPEQIASGSVAVDLVLTGALEQTVPDLGDILQSERAHSQFPLARGSLIALNADIFTPDNAHLGMWQPVEFIRRGLSGVYLLQDYDPAKEVVLFVHGIDGHPAQFEQLIDQLDPARQQAWVYFYPSGMRLETIANGLHQLMRELTLRHQLSRVKLVAHSMGGLVSYRFIQMCADKGGCPAIPNLLTLASPFGGHAAAQSGVDYAPVVMPVWRDMAPDSEFLQGLHQQPLPAGTGHQLLFAFMPDKPSDGVIVLESQLQPDIHWRASSVRGIRGQHAGILADPQAGRWMLDQLTR